MINILILEDDNNRVKEFRKRFVGIGVPVFVDTAQDAIDIIKSTAWKTGDLICLDHDLGGEIMVEPTEQNTGSTVARYLAQNPVTSTIIIHSLNTPAVDYMEDTLCNTHTVYRVPFLWNKSVFEGIIQCK